MAPAPASIAGNAPAPQPGIRQPAQSGHIGRCSSGTSAVERAPERLLAQISPRPGWPRSPIHAAADSIGTTGSSASA
jgi:hypothetical protein